jgi:hypothetical protein
LSFLSFKHRELVWSQGTEASKEQVTIRFIDGHGSFSVGSLKGAEAKTVKVKGSDQGTGLTSNFSFGGVAPAALDYLH